MISDTSSFNWPVCRSPSTEIALQDVVCINTEELIEIQDGDLCCLESGSKKLVLPIKKNQEWPMGQSEESHGHMAKKCLIICSNKKEFDS